MSRPVQIATELLRSMLVTLFAVSVVGGLAVRALDAEVDPRLLVMQGLAALCLAWRGLVVRIGALLGIAVQVVRLFGPSPPVAAIVVLLMAVPLVLVPLPGHLFHRTS